MSILKRVIILLLFSIFFIPLVSCTKSFEDYSVGIKPDGFDDPMPEIWENGYFYYPGYCNGDIAHIDATGLTEITVGINDPYWELWNAENLENIYVVDGHPTLVSEDGVLYSKSGETLIRWPAKKPVIKPKSTIKYFAPGCYSQCINFSGDFELPDGTISIGGGAFYECSLTKIHVKQNVKTVGHGAFVAKGLKTIEVSSSIVYRTFFSSNFIESIIFSEGVKQLRKSEGYSRLIDVMLNLSSVKFSTTLEAIGDVYFPVNIAVEQYTLNDNIQYLSGFAFDTNSKFGADGIGLPNGRYRLCKTEFNCSNEILTEYLVKKMPIWKQEWDAFIDKIEIAVQIYKEHGSPNESLEIYLEFLKNK